jgi:2'-5' RNA ligase
MVESGPLRLFVAVEIPGAWKAALTGEAKRLTRAAPGFGRWVDPAVMHLTLVFLGTQPAGRLPAMQEALDAASQVIAPISLRPDHLGSFGGRGAVRVVWAGIADDPPGALGRLRNVVADALRGAGTTFEEGQFHPHITLARARRDAGPTDYAAIRDALTGGPEWGFALREAPGGAHITCRSIALVKSDLRPTGPVYTALHRASLGSPS